MRKNVLMISESNDGLLFAKNKDYVILTLFSTALKQYYCILLIPIRHDCEACELVEKYFAEVHKAYYSSPLSSNTKILFAIARIEDARDIFVTVAFSYFSNTQNKVNYVPQVRAVLLPTSENGRSKVIGTPQTKEITVGDLARWLVDKFPLEVPPKKLPILSRSQFRFLLPISTVLWSFLRSVFSSFLCSFFPAVAFSTFSIGREAIFASAWYSFFFVSTPDRRLFMFILHPLYHHHQAPYLRGSTSLVAR